MKFGMKPLMAVRKAAVGKPAAIILGFNDDL
jgi:hypothetical protein